MIPPATPPEKHGLHRRWNSTHLDHLPGETCKQALQTRFLCKAPVAVEEQWGYSKGLSDVWALPPKMSHKGRNTSSWKLIDFHTTHNTLTTCNWLTEPWFATWERQLQQIWQRGWRFLKSFAFGPDQSSVLGNPAEATKTGIRRATSMA